MQVAVPAWLYFDRETEQERETRVRLKTRVRTREERRLFCSACRAAITSKDERIPILGGHEHTFVNPHGFNYHIGCFRHAHGCTLEGEETAHWTWFPGYSWRIALCANCRSHVGWRYLASQDAFHGLILKRLTSAGPQNRD